MLYSRIIIGIIVGFLLSLFYIILIWCMFFHTNQTRNKNTSASHIPATVICVNCRHFRYIIHPFNHLIAFIAITLITMCVCVCVSVVASVFVLGRFYIRAKTQSYAFRIISVRDSEA